MTDPTDESDRRAFEAGWQDIDTYHAADKFVKVQHILCGHSEKRWIRMGRYYPEMKRWYYSGTNERSQWAQVEGDEPTHWMPLPKPPEATTAPKSCGIADPSTRDCQNMKEVGGGMEGERYRCAVCGKGYFLDYEEMK